MYPIIFQINNFKISSYGVMLALAFLVSIILSIHNAKKIYNIPTNIIINLSCYIIISALVGAKLLHILLYLDYYLKEPWQIFNRSGFAYYGGFLSATLVGIIYLSKKKVSILKVGDVVGISLALGEAIARIGCLLNGCCFGKYTNYPILFKQHPTQIYTSFACFYLFLFLSYYLYLQRQKRVIVAGRVFFLYILIHAIQRIVVDNFRGDLNKMLFDFTLTQIIAILLALSAIFGLKMLKLKYKHQIR